METRTAIEMLRTAQLRIERDALLRGLATLTSQLDRLERYAQGRVRRSRLDEPLQSRLSVGGRNCPSNSE
jgi:hypothetical protein